MPHFTKQIETTDGSKTFFFNRIHTAEGLRYHVSLMDRHRKAIIFFMESDGTTWRVSAHGRELPSWITAIEQQLADAITAHLQNS